MFGFKTNLGMPKILNELQAWRDAGLIDFDANTDLDKIFADVLKRIRESL